MRRTSTISVILSVAFAAGGWFAGCDDEDEGGTPDATESDVGSTDVVEEPDQSADEEVSEESLGSAENPIIWVLVPGGDNDALQAAVTTVTDMILDESGLYVDAAVGADYDAVLAAMCSDPPQAHMSSMSAFIYLLASENGCAEAELAATRFGSLTYNGQIVARADSSFESLSDLDGTSFCRPDALSTSGWIVPQLSLLAAGIDPDTDLTEVVDMGSHDAVITAVYDGDCDAGATFVDARAIVAGTIADVMSVVEVIHVTPNIPNDGVQYGPSVPRAVRDQLNDALLAIAATGAGLAALDEMYSWQGLELIDETLYQPLRDLIENAGLTIDDLVD